VIPRSYEDAAVKIWNGTRGRTFITMGGRSALTEVAKKAPLSAAAAIEAIPKDFMMTDE
jgi:hypothetical protein